MEYSVNDQLLTYCNKLRQDEFENFISTNSLDLIYYAITNKLNKYSSKYIENKARFLKNQDYIKRLTHLLKSHGFTPLVFKGIPLASELYSNPFIRMVADIDFWVPGVNIDKISEILLSNGYSFKYSDGGANPHHLVLINNGVVFEAHLVLFHPSIGIKEDIFLNNYLLKGDCYSFNQTQTILHLLYHLYMDCCLTLSFKNETADEIIKKVRRFIYRSYEISLFFEKNQAQIDLSELVKDITSQKLNLIFNSMLKGINYIFPTAIQPIVSLFD